MKMNNTNSSLLSEKDQKEMIKRSEQYRNGLESFISLEDAKKKLGEI